MGDLQDILKYHASVLGNIPGFRACAFINAHGPETGFIHRGREFLDHLGECGYETVSAFSDMKSGLFSTMCLEGRRHVVERVLASAFCPSVSLCGMTAFERDGMLEMPSLTLLPNLGDCPDEKRRFPWLEAAVVFANKCIRFADNTTPGYVRYILNADVKRSWNEFFEKSGFLWSAAPFFEIDWREQLPEVSEKKDDSVSFRKIVMEMKGHPKNDAAVDISFRDSLVTDSFRTRRK